MEQLILYIILAFIILEILKTIKSNRQCFPKTWRLLFVTSKVSASRTALCAFIIAYAFLFVKSKIKVTAGTVQRRRLFLPKAI